VCDHVNVFDIIPCVNFIASSKQRAHLRHSVAMEKKRLEACIDKYNKLCSAAIDEFHTTSMESFLVIAYR